MVLVSTFPIFSFVLNGFLYTGGKVLIPFIPLALINTTEVIKILLSRNIKMLKIGLITYISISAIVLVVMYNAVEMYLDKDFLNDEFYANYSKYVKEDEENLYRSNSSQIDQIFINKIGNTSEYKTTVYSSLFNPEYYDAYNKLFNNPVRSVHKYWFYSANNVIYQMFMGEKYIYSRENYENIYEKIDEIGDINVYKNDYVLPIGYATDKKINRSDFENLKYPDTAINILGSKISDEATNKKIINMRDLKTNINEFTLNNIQNVDYTISEDVISANVKGEGIVDLTLNRRINDNKLIFIGFNVEEQPEDLSIQINDVKNTIANKNYIHKYGHTYCTYFLFGNEFNIKLTEGKYIISNIEIGTVDIDDLKTINKKVDSYIIDKDKTKGDKIVGTIDVKNDDSYFILSIPYDKGFSFKVDGIKTEYEKANEHFIGFNLPKGVHTIEISYSAPGKVLGMLMSIIGISSCVAIKLYENKKSKIEG